TTLHGRQDLPDFQALHRGLTDTPLVSISHSPRGQIPKAQSLATVDPGLPIQLHPPPFQPRGGYLAFLCRGFPATPPDPAHPIARADGTPPRIAGKGGKDYPNHFQTENAPLKNGSDTNLAGEIDEQEKTALLSEALALLFPIEWPEPFGVSMIE